MTASNGHIADVVEGIVDSANDRGVKVGSEWRNVSRFHPSTCPTAARAFVSGWTTRASFVLFTFWTRRPTPADRA
jgi:hypothetical protein